MIPASAVADARTAQTRTGASTLAAALALAVAGPESSYNPGAIGDNGSSFGYTQLHTNALGDGGGLGNGHTMGELLDGPTNFAIAMRYLQGRLDEGASAWDALSPWSTRPTAVGNVQEAAAALGAPATGFPRGTDAGTQSGAITPAAAGVPWKAIALAAFIIWLLGD